MAVVGAVSTISQISAQKRAASAQKKALSTQEQLQKEQLELQKAAIRAQQEQVKEEQDYNQQQIQFLLEQNEHRKNYDLTLLEQQQQQALGQIAQNYEARLGQAIQTETVLAQNEFQAGQKQTLGNFQADQEAKLKKSNVKQQTFMGKLQADMDATAKTGEAKSREQSVRGQTYANERGLNQRAVQEIRQFGRVLDDQERQSKLGQAVGAARTGTNTTNTASGQASANEQEQGRVDLYQENIDPIQDELQAAQLSGQMARRTAALEREFALADSEDRRNLIRQELDALYKYEIGAADSQRNLDRSALRMEGLLSNASISAQRKASESGLSAAEIERDLSQKNINLGSKANRLGREAEFLSENRLLRLQRQQQDALAASRQGSLTRAQQAAIQSSQSQLAALQAQRSSIQSPGLFSYLGAGLNFYNDLRGAGVFGSNTVNQTVKPYSGYNPPATPTGLMSSSTAQPYDPAVHGYTVNSQGDGGPIVNPQLFQPNSSTPGFFSYVGR